MPTTDPEARNLTADDFEFHDEDEDHVEDDDTSGSRSTTTQAQRGAGRSGPRPTISVQPSRSQYHLSGSERFSGVANRIIFSRYYILFYFVMMSLSLTTVVLSLIATHGKQCPPLAWHVLEVIINAMMVLEVSTRWVAYGKKYPMTPLNIIDLALVLFCSGTLILVFASPCSEGTRQEEVFDTILIVIRNAVQFVRLGAILRRSGHSLLNPPKPIDLSQARTASLALDLDLDLSDEEAVAERHLARSGSGNPPARSLVGSRGGGGGGAGGYEPIFTDDHDLPEEQEPHREPLKVGNNAGREELGEADEEMWDRIG